jgi:hypothetical protein
METVYRWRNQPHVRAVMPFSEEIEFAAHCLWWPRAIVDPQRRMLILEDHGDPAAIVVFTDLIAGVSARWGLYTAGRLRGAWIAADFSGMRYGFEVLGVDALYCDILHTHKAALRLREATGAERLTSRPLDHTAVGGPDFVEMRFTRAQYESGEWRHPFQRRHGLAIVPDPRDLQG